MNRTKTVVLAACFVLGAVALSHAKDPSKVAYNVALGRRVLAEIYGEGKVNLIDQLYTDDFVDDSPGGGKGRELIKEAVTDFHKACPDLHIEIEDNGVGISEEKLPHVYVEGIGLSNVRERLRVLYGTDFPYLRRDLAVSSKQRILQSSELNDSEKQDVLGGNASRLFPRRVSSSRRVI